VLISRGEDATKTLVISLVSRRDKTYRVFNVVLSFPEKYVNTECRGGDEVPWRCDWLTGSKPTSRVEKGGRTEHRSMGGWNLERGVKR
jgi:hypothetical protein